MGFPVKLLDIGTCKDCEGLHFLINEKCVVTYFPDTYKASVCECEPFVLTGEDAVSIEMLLKRIKAKEQEDKVFEDMPEEMQRILKAYPMELLRYIEFLRTNHIKLK